MLLFPLQFFESRMTGFAALWIVRVTSFGEVLLCFNREDKLFATFRTNQHSALKAVDHNYPPLLC